MRRVGHRRRVHRYPSPPSPVERGPAPDLRDSRICRDGAGVCRDEHFFVDERCFHCGAKEDPHG